MLEMRTVLNSQLSLLIPKIVNVVTRNQRSLKSQFLSNIEINQRIGGGNFGDVYRGVWRVR